MYEFDTTYSYPNHGKSIKKQMFGHKSIDYPLPIILSIYIDNSCMFLHSEVYCSSKVWYNKQKLATSGSH